jgi:hypothetical protein
VFGMVIRSIQPWRPYEHPYIVVPPRGLEP